MKFSYSWLKELVDIKLSPEKLAEFLSLHAFETEVVDNQKEFPGIIVAKVLKVEKHPNADRLRVVELTDGKNIIAPIVCGAWNFEAGAIVPLALPGAVIPGESFTLAKATIRGIESQGMICSAKELGLSNDGSGILVLDSGYKLGENFSVMDHGSETIFDISIPANRPDLISYRGVAWEIAVLTGGKYKVKQLTSKISNLKSKILKVRISEPGLCKKYLAVRLGNIQVGPSPKFIQHRLKLSGLRPINNVVDITNYVMLETGQPMHAFDASLINGPINVRKAYLNETIKTLDAVDRKLFTDMLVISDSKKALAVAGLIGGMDSGVQNHTAEIILEAANFNGVSVRRTARTLGLRTDASARFERSLPAAFINQAAELAAELLVKYAGAKLLEASVAGGKLEKQPAIKLDPQAVNNLLGTEISAIEQKRILKRFGFAVTDHGSQIMASVPFWRPDIRIWQDLAEEVVRFIGLDKIPAILPGLVNSAGMSDEILFQRDRTIDLLVMMGFNELYTYSFVSKADLDRFGIDRKTVVEVANPLSADQEFLRPNLALNVMKVAEHNSKFAGPGDYFELGNVYWKEGGVIREKTHLFMISFSTLSLPLSRLVGALQNLCERLGVQIEIKQDNEQMAQVLIGGKKIGNVGTINISDLKWIGASIDFEEFAKHIKLKQFEQIIRYPARELDVALLVKEELPWAEIRNTVLSAHNKLIRSVKLFDVYQGRNIAPGKKSLAFRIVYQAPDRTLTDVEVEKIHSQILNELKSKFNAQIRD